MTEPFFSVIIPVYNREQTIAETLESIASQEFRDFEVIVVDDGSTDSTHQIVKQYSWVKLIEQSNAGPGVARNSGATEARGKYIAFLDSDDLWFPWTLQNYNDSIKSNNALFVSGEGVEFCGDKVPVVSDTVPLISRYPDYLKAGATGLWLGTCGVAIERQTFVITGGFVTKHINSEDSDLWIRLGLASPFIRIKSPAAFAYRRASNSATKDLRKTVAGGFHLLDSERAGMYPGGASRRSDREEILGTHVRPICLECLKQKNLGDAWKLYIRSLRLLYRTRRFRFLLGTPLIAFLSLLRTVRR